MAVKKQPDSGTGELSEAANDWFRQFLKRLELYLVATGQRLNADSEPADYRLAAMRAVRLTLLDAGMNDEELRDLFGRVALANRQGPSDADVDAMGYPAGYFEATEGCFANEPLDCPRICRWKSVSRGDAVCSGHEYLDFLSEEPIFTGWQSTEEDSCE